MMWFIAIAMSAASFIVGVGVGADEGAHTKRYTECIKVQPPIDCGKP